LPAFSSKKRIILAGIIGASLLVFVFNSSLLNAISDFLVIEDTLAHADIIVVLSGDTKGRRVPTGVELFQEGYADRMVMIGEEIQWNTLEPEIMREHAVALGISKDDIHVVEQGISTYMQALSMVDLMINEGLESAIVVTSDYHTKRTRYIFRKLFLPSGLTVLVKASPSGRIQSSDWWKNSDYAKIVFYEYTKLLWYWLRY
jgi:uncharacterized SAM-binding protein YcdF (DUF218 family)